MLFRSRSRFCNVPLLEASAWQGVVRFSASASGGCCTLCAAPGTVMAIHQGASTCELKLKPGELHFLKFPTGDLRSDARTMCPDMALLRPKSVPSAGRLALDVLHFAAASDLPGTACGRGRMRFMSVRSQIACSRRPCCSQDRKSTRLNSSHSGESRMPSSA